MKEKDNIEDTERAISVNFLDRCHDCHVLYFSTKYIHHYLDVKQIIYQKISSNSAQNDSKLTLKRVLTEQTGSFRPCGFHKASLEIASP